METSFKPSWDNELNDIDNTWLKRWRSHLNQSSNTAAPYNTKKWIDGLRICNHGGSNHIDILLRTLKQSSFFILLTQNRMILCEAINLAARTNSLSTVRTKDGSLHYVCDWTCVILPSALAKRDVVKGSVFHKLYRTKCLNNEDSMVIYKSMSLLSSILCALGSCPSL